MRKKLSLLVAITLSLNSCSVISDLMKELEENNIDDEIGVLRAIGARGFDIFKIFFSEGIFISLLSFTLSSIITGIICYVFNVNVMNSLYISILDFGIVNIIVILTLSLLVSLIATFIPTHIYNKKPPVDSIRQL